MHSCGVPPGLGTPYVGRTLYCSGSSAFTPPHSTSVPMGSIVISTRSPDCSVNASGGMIPVPVSSTHPGGIARLAVEILDELLRLAAHLRQRRVALEHDVAAARDAQRDRRARRQRVVRDVARRAPARTSRRTPSPAADRAGSLPRCRASSRRCRSCSRRSCRARSRTAPAPAPGRSTSRRARMRIGACGPRTRHADALKNSSGRAASYTRS